MLVTLVVLAVPFVVAVVVLREPRWYSTIDVAQIELKVRDTLTAHPPLTGLGGRIAGYGPDQGSHPGPLSFGPGGRSVEDRSARTHRGRGSGARPRD